MKKIKMISIKITVAARYGKYIIGEVNTILELKKSNRNLNFYSFIK